MITIMRLADPHFIIFTACLLGGDFFRLASRLGGGAVGSKQETSGPNSTHSKSAHCSFLLLAGLWKFGCMIWQC